MEEGELRHVIEVLDELRLLMRVGVALLAVMLVAIVVAAIVIVSTAGQVQQQLGIG